MSWYGLWFYSILNSHKPTSLQRSTKTAGTYVYIYVCIVYLVYYRIFYFLFKKDLDFSENNRYIYVHVIIKKNAFCYIYSTRYSKIHGKYKLKKIKIKIYIFFNLLNKNEFHCYLKLINNFIPWAHDHLKCFFDIIYSKI